MGHARTESHRHGTGKSGCFSRMSLKTCGDLQHLASPVAVSTVSVAGKGFVAARTPNVLAKAKMMLQKQQREKAEADWPRPRITPGCSMAPLPESMSTCSVLHPCSRCQLCRKAIDQSFVDMTAARAKGATVPKSYKPMHQVDAAKDLSGSTQEP